MWDVIKECFWVVHLLIAVVIIAALFVFDMGNPHLEFVLGMLALAEILQAFSGHG